MTKRIQKIIACAAMAGLLSIFVLGCTCICAKQTSTDGHLVILQEPQSQFVAVNSTVNFSVVAMHTGPPSTNAITYRWMRNGVAIAGAESSTYSRTNVQLSDAAVFTVRVSGSTLFSDPAYLSVFSSSGNGGTLSQVIDAFGNSSSPCASGFPHTYAFYPLSPPYGYVPPTGTTKVSIDTFDTRNGSYDTAVEVFQRPQMHSVCCNDTAASPPSYNMTLSQCTNVATLSGDNYRYGIYVKGSPPAGTVFYLNYTNY